MGSSEEWLRKSSIKVGSYDTLLKAGSDLINDIKNRYFISIIELPALYEARNSEMLEVRNQEKQIADGIYNFKGGFFDIYSRIYQAFFLQTTAGIEVLIREMLKRDIEKLQMILSPGQLERAGNIEGLVNEGMNIFRQNLKFRGPGFAYIEAILETYRYIRNQI